MNGESSCQCRANKLEGKVGWKLDEQRDGAGELRGTRNQTTPRGMGGLRSL